MKTPVLRDAMPMVVLVVLCGLFVASHSSQAHADEVLRDLTLEGAGYSDVPLYSHFVIVEDHWIWLEGVATLSTPCGSRELNFRFECSGRERFVPDLYLIAVSLPVGRFTLTDPGADDVVVFTAQAGAVLAYVYPRPSGSPYFTLNGTWRTAERREFLADCGWSELTVVDGSAAFSFRPSPGAPVEEQGSRISATGVLRAALETPVSTEPGISFGRMKSAFVD